MQAPVCTRSTPQRDGVDHALRILWVRVGRVGRPPRNASGRTGRAGKAPTACGKRDPPRAVDNASGECPGANAADRRSRQTAPRPAIIVPCLVPRSRGRSPTGLAQQEIAIGGLVHGHGPGSALGQSANDPRATLPGNCRPVLRLGGFATRGRWPGRRWTCGSIADNGASPSAPAVARQGPRVRAGPRYRPQSIRNTSVSPLPERVSAVDTSPGSSLDSSNRDIRRAVDPRRDAFCTRSSTSAGWPLATP